MTEMKPYEYLAQARDQIDRGWTQGAVKNSQGVCAVGAMAEVAQQNWSNNQTDSSTMDDFIGTMEAGNVASSFLLKYAKELGGASIISYNDGHCKSKQDALNWFEKAIIGLEEQGL